ncbi:MAG: hypothetical protein M1835_002734 [Candelina submexicana]|nr:MAG: hypothetical protein M1835_002734 [Candelina submexicana]
MPKAKRPLAPPIKKSTLRERANLPEETQVKVTKIEVTKGKENKSKQRKIKVVVVPDKIVRLARLVYSPDSPARQDLILVICFFLAILQYIFVLLVGVRRFVLRWVSPAEPPVSSSSFNSTLPPHRTLGGNPQPSPTRIQTPTPVPRLLSSFSGGFPAESSYVHGQQWTLGGPRCSHTGTNSPSSCHYIHPTQVLDLDLSEVGAAPGLET